MRIYFLKEVTGATKTLSKNLLKVENSAKNSLDWNRIMDEIDASQLIHLGDQLTTTRAEVLEMGHPIDELLVSVSSLLSTPLY